MSYMTKNTLLKVEITWLLNVNNFVMRAHTPTQLTIHKYTSRKNSTQNYLQRCTTHLASCVPLCSLYVTKTITKILTYNTYLITQFNKVTQRLLRTSAEKSLVFFFSLLWKMHRFLACPIVSLS